MKEIYSFVREILSMDKRVVLMVVVDAEGSSPGKAGFKMVVTEDGLLKGSIGGGQTEYRLVEKAKKILSESKNDFFIKREVHRPEAEMDRSGMICSGEQWVAFYPFSKKDLSGINRLLDSIETDKKGVIHYSQNGIDFHENEEIHHQHKKAVSSPSEWLYMEESANINHLFVFGAGHVGLALCRIMNQLSFCIHLFDDRVELNAREENEYVNSNHIVDYKNIKDLVPEGPHSYVVIMTFGHKSDETVLRQLLTKDVKYLGMMGSKKKVAAIFSNLREEGFTDQKLKKVDAPIGLAIGSQTPNEIAVSIAAKIIQVKNETRS